MAINPEIALGFRPPQLAPLEIQSPLDRYQKMLTLRHLMQQGQLGQMNIEHTGLENEALRRTAQDEQSLGSWMRQNQRPDLTASEIVANHPNPTGLKVATAWSAQQKANMEAQAAAITNRLNTLKAIDREMQGITDNETKAAALSNAVTNKWMTGEQAAPYLSMDVADPRWKDFTTRIQSQTMDGTQRAEFAAAEIKARIARNTEASATAGTNAEGDKKVLDAAQAQRASDAARVAAAFDLSPEAGAAVLRTLAQDPNRFAPFKDVTTAAQARNAGLTAEQQAAGARADAPSKPPALMSPETEAQQTRLRIAGAPRLPSPGLTPEAEAQEIRIAQARAEGQPATEAENRSLGFYDRSASADKTLEGVKDYISNKSTVGMWLTQTAPNSVLSKEEQSYMQGARQFINAYLRRDSGAAIQPSEWDEAYKTFLPYPGDKPETLALKARERKVIIEGLKISAGRAHSRKYGAPDATPTKQGGDQKKGDVIIEWERGPDGKLRKKP